MRLVLDADAAVLLNALVDCNVAASTVISGAQQPIPGHDVKPVNKGSNW